ncbi:asparagine synthase-related protein [Haloarchaeobius amylolyticus]|uniref:asparagine synthase-related protein n=1 Tax=Haloarchaeobius amylolyticus TaxID=1198296 RepID=UPI002271E003|nr:asparagine synthase-related protein [Haloarchaeobius amylolyticus]
MTTADPATDATDTDADATMNQELFGVFGDRETFARYRQPGDFDVLVESDAGTVGIRSHELTVPGRTTTYSCDRGGCALFGEVVGTPDTTNPAAWLFRRYREEGRAAFDALNGSYLAFVAVDGEAVVATDPLRTWECFHAVVGGTRIFGTDITGVEGVLDDPGPDRDAVLELLHLGTVIGEKTLFEPIRRVPADATLTAAGTRPLSRFVYDPGSFDYAEELARRLERAIRRRSHYPGRKGILLSAGDDSRVLLSQVPDIERSYTVGSEDSREVRVAQKLADQYGADHEVLEPGARYLYPTEEKPLYAQSIKEGLHIHQAGYAHEFDVDVMYHGLLFDTLFKGFFLEWDDTDAFGATLPSNRLVDDPAPVDSLLDTLGFMPEASAGMGEAVAGLFEDHDLPVDPHVDSPREFLAQSLSAELDACRDRVDSLHNATDLLMLRNQPVLPFRTHLADNFVEPFVAMDAELLEWHRRTPPAYRNRKTCRRALKRIDGDLFRHRAPSRPHRSAYLNLAERFVRLVVPFVEEFEPAWPDRQTVYEENDIAARLFPDHEAVRELPERQQLRVNGLRWWLG